MTDPHTGARDRETRLAATFVTLADTLVTGYDVLELLHVLVERCVELLDAAEVGIMLDDQRGTLRIAAASSESTRQLELLELQVSEGPCLDCITTGQATISRDLAADAGKWPHFAQQAQEKGFRSVSAIPLRLRHQVIGALNLFHTGLGGLDADDQHIGQALADVATIGILQERAVRRGEVVTEQLQTALNSRIAIEQAKGILAERASDELTVDEAFDVMRGYARAHGRLLSELAREIVEQTADVDAILARRPRTAASADED